MKTEDVKLHCRWLLALSEALLYLQAPVLTLFCCVELVAAQSISGATKTCCSACSREQCRRSWSEVFATYFPKCLFKCLSRSKTSIIQSFTLSYFHSYSAGAGSTSDSKGPIAPTPSLANVEKGVRCLKKMAMFVGRHHLSGLRKVLFLASGDKIRPGCCNHICATRLRRDKESCLPRCGWVMPLHVIHSIRAEG